MPSGPSPLRRAFAACARMRGHPVAGAQEISLGATPKAGARGNLAGTRVEDQLFGGYERPKKSYPPDCRPSLVDMKAPRISIHQTGGSQVAPQRVSAGRHPHRAAAVQSDGHSWGSLVRACCPASLWRSLAGGRRRSCRPPSSPPLLLDARPTSSYSPAPMPSDFLPVPVPRLCPLLLFNILRADSLFNFATMILFVSIVAVLFTRVFPPDLLQLVMQLPVRTFSLLLRSARAFSVLWWWWGFVAALS